MINKLTLQKKQFSPSDVTLDIVDQPKSEMRFRYKSEQKANSHGSLMGSKGFPTVELKNYNADNKVLIRASLYTYDESERHVHCFQGKDDVVCTDGVCTIALDCETKTAVFKNLQIEYCAKKDLQDELLKRYARESAKRTKMELLKKAEEEAKRLKKDPKYPYVKILFQAYNSNGVEIARVFSSSICDSRSVTCNKLKICHICPEVSPVEGNQKIIILCDKIQKDNIEVHFEDQKNQWKKIINSEELFVHYQYGIVFNTPQYEKNDLSMKDEIEVEITLYRPSDKQYSEPVKFKYISCDQNDLNDRKRRKRNHCSDSDSGHYSYSSSESSLSPFSNLENDAAQSTSANLESNLIQVESAVTQGNEFSNNNAYPNPVTTDVLGSDNQANLMSNSADPFLISDSLDWDMNSNDFPSFWDEFLNSGVEFYTDSTITSSLKKLNINENFTENNEKNVKSEEKAVENPPLSSLKQLFICLNNSVHNCMHRAILYNKIDVLKAVLNRMNCMLDGMNRVLQSVINKKDPMGETLIHTALRSKSDPEIITTLLENGMDVKTTDKSGNTPFHLAADHESENYLSLLFRFTDYESVMNCTNDEGLTPLLVSIKSNSDRCCRYLLSKGVDATVTNRKGETALHIAIIFNAPQLVKDLIPKLNINSQDKEGLTALHVACLSEDVNLVKILINGGADPYKKCILGKTPFDLSEKNNVIREILVHHKESELTAVKDEIFTIPDDIMTKLEKILNPPNFGWEKVALFAGIDKNTAQGIKQLNKDNPIKAVFRMLLQKKRKTRTDLLQIFKSAELKEAYEILNKATS